MAAVIPEDIETNGSTLVWIHLSATTQSIWERVGNCVGAVACSQIRSEALTDARVPQMAQRRTLLLRKGTEPVCKRERKMQQHVHSELTVLLIQVPIHQRNWPLTDCQLRWRLWMSLTRRVDSSFKHHNKKLHALQNNADQTLGHLETIHLGYSLFSWWHTLIDNNH